MALPDVLWRLFLGQVLSFCVSLTGLFSNLLAQQNASVPLLQSTTAYFLIFVIVAPVHYHYRSVRLASESTRQSLTAQEAASLPAGDASSASVLGVFFSSHFPKWRYLVIACFDVGASFFAIAAYTKTDITSAQLLDDATIVTVMLLGYLFLQRRFNWRHFVGVALAVGGMVGLVMADAANASRDSTKTAPDPVAGDVMMLIAATLYGFTNTACEAFLKSDRVVVPSWCAACWPREESANNASAVAEPREDGAGEEDGDAAFGSVEQVRRCAHLIFEYVTFLTLFGFCISFVLLLATSTGNMRDAAANWSWHCTLFQVAFCCVMVGTYVGLPVVLKLTTATFTVLSLLTADAYSVVLNYVTSGTAPTGLYYGMAAVILVGTVLFDTAEKQCGHDDDDADTTAPAVANEAAPDDDGDSRQLVRVAVETRN